MGQIRSLHGLHGDVSFHLICSYLYMPMQILVFFYMVIIIFIYNVFRYLFIYVQQVLDMFLICTH